MRSRLASGKATVDGDEVVRRPHLLGPREQGALVAAGARQADGQWTRSSAQVLIPTESVLEMVKGQRRTTTRKFFPGYMFVQMELNEETFHLVKNTPKITGFLGGTKPTPVPEKDIAADQHRRCPRARPSPSRASRFEEGENVRVIDGPFANFSGIVEEVKAEKQKVARPRQHLRPRDAGRAGLRPGRESVSTPAFSRSLTPSARVESIV